jgi:hypothetical protein
MSQTVSQNQDEIETKVQEEERVEENIQIRYY